MPAPMVPPMPRPTRLSADSVRFGTWSGAVVAARGLLGQHGRRFSDPEIYQVIGILQMSAETSRDQSAFRIGAPSKSRIGDFPAAETQRAGAAPSDGAAEIEPLDDIVASQLFDRIGRNDDLAMDDDVAAGGDPDRLVEVLLRHQHREAEMPVEFADLADGLRYQQRRQPDRRLVDQQQPRRRTSARARSPASAAGRPTWCRPIVPAAP